MPEPLGLSLVSSTVLNLDKARRKGGGGGIRTHVPSLYPAECVTEVMEPQPGELRVLRGLLPGPTPISVRPSSTLGEHIPTSAATIQLSKLAAEYRMYWNFAGLVALAIPDPNHGAAQIDVIPGEFSDLAGAHAREDGANDDRS